MALIICVECGKEFSDKAAACPQCGCPTELARPREVGRQEESRATQTKQEQPSASNSPSPKRKDLTRSVKSTSEKQGYMHNRAQSRPLAIGIVVGAVAPFTSIFWGLRQGSWWLGLLPVGLAATLSYYYPRDFSDDKTPKYFIQALAGITAYGISRKLKKDAKEKGFGAPNKNEAKAEIDERSDYSSATVTNESVNNVFSGISLEQSTKKIGGIALTLLAAGGGVMISRGIREAIKQNPVERDDSKVSENATPRKQNENMSFLSPWSWDISRDCLRAERELVSEARKLHPSQFASKYEISPGKLVSQDWSKTSYPDNFDAYQEMTWQTVYSSLTFYSPLAPQHCEVRDIYDHISECTENELKEVPWTQRERKWVKKAVLFKDYCS